MRIAYNTTIERQRAAQDLGAAIAQAHPEATEIYVEGCRHGFRAEIDAHGTRRELTLVEIAAITAPVPIPNPRPKREKPSKTTCIGFFHEEEPHAHFCETHGYYHRAEKWLTKQPHLYTYSYRCAEGEA